MPLKNSSFDIGVFFQALSDPTRLRLLNLLADEEVCVCHLVDVLGTNQPKVSRHLAYLRRAGLVTARRQGTWMHYRMVEPSDPLAHEVMRNLRGWLGAREDMREDLQRLKEMVKPLARAS